ncbi:TPA: ROK family protein [Klebsiella pneumoniae]|uniref:ROK family protein n=1 Tax=Klebsiella pneumoniae TaxID=573 RepID=UPI0029786EBA|nr:ROK family protein [Klebsiella pneumoniae]HEG2637760.1 ROK family protein [Klebsiella pneumoniae]HEG3580983.1 ROK family protein [Klebsiella pneumoniae]HEG3604286.1 ROK family protein [Klebsiella pneumoniae]HEG3651958.1 ROK family protein [Klebsiella pneumoniae]
MAHSSWPALVFARHHDAAVISRALRRGRLQRLARGIYSGDVHTPAETLTRRYLWEIVSALFPGAVVAGPTAIQADPAACATIYLIHSRRRALALAGVTLVPVAGVGPQPDDIRLTDNLWLASPARCLLWFFSQPEAERDLARLHAWRQATQIAPDALLAAIIRQAAALNRESALPDAAAFLDQTPAPQSAPAGLPPLGMRARQLLESLITDGSAMQSELITRLTMSKSTVSSGLQELQRHQLIVTLEGERRGAQLYQLSRQTGWVLGADIGNTQVLLVARGLDGGQLALRQFTHTGSVQLVKAAADAIAALRQELASLGPLLAIAVALSKPVRPDIQLSGREGPSQAGQSPEAILARLALPSGVPVIVENNVNCAVVAEVRHGIAKGLKDVVFLQIGDRIGSGILSGGVVIHGARGGAGEIADIPFPWSLHESPGELMLEWHLAKQGFLERLNTSRPAASPVVRSFDALLERAAAGEPLAMQAVEKYGEQIGFLAAGLVAILDPAMIVTGGSVGSNWLIVAAVRKTLAAISPHTVVAASQWGQQATVEGAVQLALDAAQIRLLGRAVKPR